MRVTGIVIATHEKTTDKGKRYGIKLKEKEKDEPEWYNGFGSLPDIKEGDIINIEYEEKDGFKNIKKISKMDAEQKTLEEVMPKKEPQLIQIRQFCIATAVELFKNEKQSPQSRQDFFRMVKRIEKYLLDGGI